MADDKKTDWFKSAFSHDYIRIYAHRSTDEAQANIRSLLDRLNLAPDALCLDLCCGFGRHLSFLNQQGINAIGCDLSLDLLLAGDDITRRRAVQADMRALPYRTNSLDFVFSFFTSFGYFLDDDENGQVIDEIARVLKPGGGFVIDFLNPHQVRRTLVPSDEQIFPEFTVTQRRWIDGEESTVNKELTVLEDGDVRTYHERVKLYTRDDFTRFFDKAELHLVEVIGTAQGEPYSEASPRMIMIGKK